MANFSYVATKPGMAKIFTILIGVVTFGLAIHGHYKTEFLARNVATLHANSGFLPERHNEERELFLIWVSAILLIISAIYFIIHTLSRSLANNKGNKMLDAFYHFIGGILLMISGGFMVYNTIELDEDTCRYLQYQYGGVSSPYIGSLGALGFGGFNLGAYRGFNTGHYSHGDTELCREMFNFGQKLAAGIFAIFNGIIYAITAVFALQSPHQNEDQFEKE